MSTLSYPEQDKLGPLGAQSSAIHDAVALRAALLRAFEAAVHEARDAVGTADRDAAEAVHASRKGLRRARAILALLGPALPKSERRAVRTALQQARRSLSSVRDHAVAPETLQQLALDEQTRATSDQVLATAAQALPATTEIKQLLGESAARAAAQVEALQAALPRELTWDDVSRGLRETYGEARDAIGGAKGSKGSFHTWRRRSKELVYQLDFIAKHGGPRLAAIHEEFVGVTDTLGPVVDLIMLREFVETYDQGLSRDALDQLRDEIDAKLEDAMKKVRKEARDAFHPKPKKFEKRVAKSLRRDLAPPDEADGGASDLQD